MILTFYERDILNRLINIYERRLYNNSDFRQAVALRINSKDFNEYFNNQDKYDEAINNLIELKHITVKLLKYQSEFERVILNIDKMEEIYNCLNRTNLNKLIQEFEDDFFSYNNDTIGKLQDEYLKTKEDRKSIRGYLATNFIDAIKGAYYLELNEEEIYERYFSANVYNDSKRLEQLKPMIESFYKTNEDIFEKYKVVKKPTYLYIKGKGTIIVNDEGINLSKIKDPVGFTINNKLNINFKDVSKVITIENETTFYNYEDNDSLIIYLAGFSNSHKIYILNKLNKVTKNIYHYGDMDYGGFNILAHLRSNVSSNIKPFRMDLVTLKKLSDHHIEITDSDYLNSLKTLLTNDLLNDCYDVISYMIKNKVKTEQESGI